MMNIGLLSIFVGLFSLSGISEPILSTPPKTEQSQRYKFSKKPSWADEFSINGLPDSSKWSYDLGSPYNGWGNNELQYYTKADSENVFVLDGKLNIKAINEKQGDLNYTSARLVSKGKGDFLYGRIEVKAKVPSGRGTWAAAWMLPTDWEYGGWPASGEIDILEHVGYDQDVVHITMHTYDYNHSKGTQRGNKVRIEKATQEFHIYRVDWTPDYIKGFVDNVEILHFPNEKNGSSSWPFDKRFHLLLNLAVGGSWGGQQGVDDNAFPALMQVDYVRVYDLVQ